MVVNIGDKKNTVSISFSNVLLTWYKLNWWKKFKSNTKPNFKYYSSLIQSPKIQPGVFLPKMRDYIRYGRQS